MDFITLFAIYVGVVLTCIVLVCKYSGQQQTPFGLLFNSVSELILPWTPKWIQDLSKKILHNLFHQRNNAFVYTHLLLEGAVYAEFTFEVFGYCRDMDTTLASLSVPYVLLAVKSVFFYLCIKRDPGTVTKRRHACQLQVYPYDLRMYHPAVACPTCHLTKPARSKHCRVCERCVQRFDHHCVWVNNCIGAQNARYFLLYLLSVCVMAADMALLTTDMLLHAVLRSGILRASYIDEDGQQRPAGPLFVAQHLFLTFPRIVFMLGFLVFLFLLLAGYAAFHTYLALVNQTTNEWYKSRGYVCQHCHPNTTTTTTHSTAHSASCGPTADYSRRHFYSRGLLRNLGEIFFPLKASHKKNN